MCVSFSEKKIYFFFTWKALLFLFVEMFVSCLFCPSFETFIMLLLMIIFFNSTTPPYFLYQHFIDSIAFFHWNLDTPFLVVYYDKMFRCSTLHWMTSMNCKIVARKKTYHWISSLINVMIANKRNGHYNGQWFQTKFGNLKWKKKISFFKINWNFFIFFKIIKFWKIEKNKNRYMRIFIDWLSFF